jgi:hypothetical protein
LINSDVIVFNRFSTEKIYFKIFAFRDTMCYIYTMKSEVLHIRVDKELREKLQKMADADSRTLGDFIRIQLTKISSSKKK